MAIVVDDDDEAQSHGLGRRMLAEGKRWYSCNVKGCAWGHYAKDIVQAIRAHAKLRPTCVEKELAKA